MFLKDAVDRITSCLFVMQLAAGHWQTGLPAPMAGGNVFDS